MDVRQAWESVASKHYKVEAFFLHVIYIIWWNFGQVDWLRKEINRIVAKSDDKNKFVIQMNWKE